MSITSENKDGFESEEERRQALAFSAELAIKRANRLTGEAEATDDGLKAIDLANQAVEALIAGLNQTGQALESVQEEIHKRGR